ncbi:MAG: hypothetical protein C4558_06005 [Dehalococcoidia bacterium]|nr:MAG: hypothetical protein C4558_06005 [Dehalococcoidia bacterium]
MAGDIVWTFAQEFPFFDPRAATALAWTMAPIVGSTQGAPVLPADAGLRRGVRPGDIPLLMEAAGLRARPGTNTPPSLKVTGRCRIWVAASPAGITANAPLDKSAESIGSAFAQTMRDLLGVTIAPCTTTADVAEAQILVWIHGGPVPANPMRPIPTLVAPNIAQPLPGQPAPARTGNAGLDVGGPGIGAVLAMLVATAAAALAVRALARRAG